MSVIRCDWCREFSAECIVCETCIRERVAKAVAEERVRCLAACQEVYDSLMAKSLSKVPMALAMRKIEGGK
jgi:hypothetical protein